MQWPLLLNNDDKINVYSSCQGLEIPPSAEFSGSDLFEWPQGRAAYFISIQELARQLDC